MDLAIVLAFTSDFKIPCLTRQILESAWHVATLLLAIMSFLARVIPVPLRQLITAFHDIVQYPFLFIFSFSASLDIFFLNCTCGLPH